MDTKTIEAMNATIAEADRQLKSTKSSFEQAGLLDSIAELGRDITAEASDMTPEDETTRRIEDAQRVI